MTTFVPFGSTPLATDRLPDEQMYDNDGSFVRGVRAGVYGMGSGLRNAAGAVTDAFDYDNFAAQQYGAADRLAQKAGRVGPRISSLKQLGDEGYSLGNVTDYAAGVMGTALPSMGVGIGATLASGGALLPSLAAGTLAYTPMEMGDAVAKWRQANPGQQIDGDTVARLGLTGLASAGAQSFVPAVVGGKLAGRGLASAPVAGLKQAATRNLAEIPMEGFTEGLGEGIKQIGATPEAPTDWEQIGENAVAGAIGGVPAAGVGALGDYAHGNRQAVVDTASRAAKAVGKALEPAARAAEGAKTAMERGFGDAWTAMSDLGESAWKGVSESDLGKTLSERVAKTQQRVQDILDDPEVPAEWKAKVENAARTAGNKTSAAIVAAVDATRNKVKQAREEGIRKTTLDTLRGSVDAVINGDYLGNKADLANGTDEQVSSRLRDSARKAANAAKTWAEDLLRRPDVNDADKAEVNDAMSNPDDPTGPQRVAAKWKLYDAKDRMVKGFQDIKARFKKGFDSANDDPNAPKKSEDYSGVRAVIGEALRPHMVRINEAVGKDPKALEEVADSLRTYIEAVTDTEGKKTDAVDRGFARMRLTQFLGDDAAGIMADVAEAVGRGQTREQTDRVFEELNELQALQRSHGDLVRMMTRALPKEQRSEVYADIERVVRWATGADVQGKDASQNEIKFRNQKMEADLQRKYGAKAKAIMTQVEQMLSPKQGARYDPEADRRAAEEDGTDYETALREEELQEESRFIGSGANRKGLFVDPKIHAKNYPEEAAQGKGTGNELKRDVVDKEFPNSNVRFVSVAEDPTIFDRSPTEKSAMTKKRKELEAELPGDENASVREQALAEFREERIKKLAEEGRGMFRVDHSSHERLSVEEIDAMRMDTANFGNTDHPSRLEIKPEGSQRAAHVFDATRVTKVAMKRINREREWTKGDDINQLTRMGRAFSDGVTALMQEYGKFRITPDLVIGHINGKPITAREAMKVDKRTDKDLRNDDQTMEAADIRKRGKEIQELSKQTTDKAVLKELREEYNELKGRLKFLERSRQGRINSDLAAKTAEDIETALSTIKKRLVTENSATEREKLVKEMEYLTRRLDDMNERNMYEKSFQDGARQDADPNGNIHEASARLSENELQARMNMDGTLKTPPTTYTPSAKALVSVAGRVSAAGGIGETIAKRLFALAFNFSAVSKKDQYALLELRGASTPSAVGEVVNQMAKKYASALTLTRAQNDAIEKMMEMAREGGDPGTAYTSVEQANSLIGQQVASASIERLTQMLKDHQRRLARYEEKNNGSEAFERVTNAMRTEIGWMQERMETLQQQAPTKPKKQPKLRTGREEGEYSTPVMESFLGGEAAEFKPSPYGEEVRTAADKNDLSARDRLINQVRRGRSVPQKDRHALRASLERQEEYGEPLSRPQREALELLRKEGTPDPKAQAAQEAALQQATSAGDAPAILQALVARFAPDMQIEIGDREARGNGRLITHTDGTFTISLKEGLTPVQVASTLAHEFGHALMKHKFSTAPATVRNEIMAAYQADAEAVKGGSVQELVEKFGHVAGRITVDGRKQTAAELIAKRDAAAGREGYTLSFDEWFANQVSKYATSGGFENLSPEVKGFWQQVLQTLKDTYRAFAKEMRPAPSFEQWMNQLAKQAELRVTEKQEQVLRGAIEGDKTLIDSMALSTDVQKLQRVVGFLNNFSGMGKVDDAIDAANNRLRELVKDEDQAYHVQTRKYSLLGVKPQENSSPEQRLNDRLSSLLAERGIRVEQAAFEGVPVEMRVSLINRVLQADPGQPMAQDVARFLSWMTIGSEFYDSIAQGISGSKFEADIAAQVNRDARQSLYTPARKQREVVRRAVEQLLTNGLYKKHAAEAPLSAKVLQLVRQAIQNILTALGGVKYKELQGIADGFIDDLLAGRVRLERPRAEGTVLLKPYDVFAEDPHAADLTYALTDGKGFALTGSLAYAAKGTVYRQAGAAIHDLDFTTSLSQQNAEQRLERLYPQASKVRSFGGLGSFVTTYVVPPRGHTVDLMNVQDGVVKGFVVRDADRKIVGRYTNDGKESSSGVKATVVDLIGDSREITDRMTIPTSFGDRSIPISNVADAMAEKLTYARDKDIVDFANFVPFEKGGVQTRKYSLEKTDDISHGFMRRVKESEGKFLRQLADDESARSTGAYASQGASFGNTKNGVTLSAKSSDGTVYVYIIDQGLVGAVNHEFARLQREGAGLETELDVLEKHAIQYAYYDPNDRRFGSISPERGTPAFSFHDARGDLEPTPHRWGDEGEVIQRVVNVTRQQLVDLYGRVAAFHKFTGDGSGGAVEWDRASGANPGKTGGTFFSQDKVNRQQYPNVGPSEPLDAKAIRDHLFKVLGDTVQVEFANLMYAGDFTRQDGEDIIRISVHALNPMTVAYHESLHAFFQQLKDKGLPDVVQAVFKGLNTPHIMRQLRERLKDSPEALAQLSDPEERAAYAYQFWASDPTFKLTEGPRTVFEKIAAAIRKVLGVWSNDERALEIFKYFHSGKYQQQTASKLAIHTATMRAGRNSTIDTVAHMIKPLKKLGDAVVGAGGERLRDSGIPALRELADLIKLRGIDEGRDGGFIPAARLARTEHMNWLATHLQEYGADALNEALEAMQAGRKASTTQAKIVQKLVQEKFLRQMMFDKYLPDAGVELGDLGPDYFPRVWDPAYISKNQEAFAEMLESYGVKNVDAVIQKIVSGNGTEWGFDDNAQIEIERPGFVNTRERKMAFISGEDALPFLQKDFWKTMDSYVTQATRRGEWSRRFGYKNEKFDDLLGRAVRQGATAEQIEMARNFAKAVDGTLGDNIDPSYRRLMGNMIVYQNLRLLPLAIFSSLVDPLGVVVRGGTVRDGWNTFKRGIKEMRKSWQKDPSFDADTMLAEEIGTIEDAMLQHTISSMYGQGLMGDTAQKINDLFFRYNLMEGFNRSMRVGATQAALGFIGRHAKGANEHSTRYLAELGLKADEVKFDDDGKIVIDERVKLAVNRWVDGAVLRPNAAETPIWMHDPHYALFAHLKQFAFAFHHTFLKRVWHEYQHGNYKPVMALASFVPMMMAADFVKDMIANGGDEPEWKRQWTFMDHVGYGVERAGILGVGQFALDGIGDIRHGGTGIGALGGPTLDQLTDAVSVLGGRREFGSFALRSMPANSLYRGYVGPADEMEFEGDSLN